MDLIHIFSNNSFLYARNTDAFPQSFCYLINRVWSRAPCYHWLLSVLTLNLVGKWCQEVCGYRIFSPVLWNSSRKKKKSPPHLNRTSSTFRLWCFTHKHFPSLTLEATVTASFIGNFHQGFDPAVCSLLPLARLNLERSGLESWQSLQTRAS